jgi:hypothetical protein
VLKDSDCTLTGLLWKTNLQYAEKQSNPPHTTLKCCWLLGRCSVEKPALGEPMSPEHYTSKTTWWAPYSKNWKMRCHSLFPSPWLINKLEACKSWNVYCMHESMYVDSLKIPCQYAGFWMPVTWASGIRNILLSGPHGPQGIRNILLSGPPSLSSLIKCPLSARRTICYLHGDSAIEFTSQSCPCSWGF